MTFLKTIFDKVKKFYHKHILRRKYYKFGKCNMCGACCENIYVFHSGKIIKTKEDFLELQNKTDYPFYRFISITGSDEFGLIFKCDKFDETKKLCKDHKRRPSICRNYPSEEIFKLGASLKEGCGYGFEPIEKFDEVLKKVLKRPPENFKEL